MPNNAIILQTSDFTDFHQVAVSNLLTPLLQASINKWEVYYIMQLLGNQVTTQYPKGLGQLFIDECKANFPNGPTSARFTKIFQTFDIQVGRIVRHSNGIKDILLSAVFYHYINDKTTNDGQAGVVQVQVDAAKKVAFKNSFRFAESRFNDMLDSWDNVQWYVRNGDGTGSAGHGGSIDYPEYIQPKRMKAAYSSIF